MKSVFCEYEYENILKYEIGNIAERKFYESFKCRFNMESVF